MTEKSSPVTAPTFLEALRFWVKLGCISFGGPAGQIAIMHKELVETKRWISEEHFLHALNFTMLLPGPEAQQLATYLGWRLHGIRGGIAAGALFVIPSMFVLFGLSWLYVAGQDISWLTAFFHGLLAAVIAILAQALIKIGGKSLKTPALWAVAILSFASIYFFEISFVYIILSVALTGYVGHLFLPKFFPSAGSKKLKMTDSGAHPLFLKLRPVPSHRISGVVKILGVGLVLWATPVILAALHSGWGSTLAQQGLFFSKAAMVTVGGAYAVLPYVAQQAVENYGWLSHAQMMAGLGLAETTPGPLVIVLQFVGFLGGWFQPDSGVPLLGAVLGSLMTVWVTFIPCFIFIFLGGPYVERIGSVPKFSAALTATTAAVVGVILNLGVDFGTHALWKSGGGLDWLILSLAIASFIALQRFKVGVIPVIGLCGLAGVLQSFL